MHVRPLTSFGMSCVRVRLCYELEAMLPHCQPRALTMNVSPRFRSRACRILLPAGSSPAATIAAAERRPSPSAAVCCAAMREALPRDATRDGTRAAPHTRGDVPYCKCAVLRRACGKKLAAWAPAQGLRWCQACHPMRALFASLTIAHRNRLPHVSVLQRCAPPR